MAAELFSIDGRVALVTGGSRGIGAMIARGFAAAGARVYVASRKSEELEKTASEIGATAIPADLSSVEGCEHLAGELAAREDHLDILVNNAGATWGAPLEEFPDSGFDRVLSLNVKGVFHLTRLLLPLLRKAATPDDPARVINIGSIDGMRVPAFENFSYSASKAGVHMLTRHLAHRLAPEITVNAIAPGLFESRMTKFVFDEPGIIDAARGAIPLGREGRQDDIAGAAIFLASRAGSWLTGVVLPVDGGVSTHG